MNILQIVHCFPPESMTGSEIYAYNLSKELSKNHNVSIFYRINNPSRREYELIEASYNDLDVYKINNTLRESNSLDKIYRNSKVEKKFLEVLNKVRPDVVHVHHLLFLSTGILDELKKHRIPVVFTLHDYWLVCPRGQLLRNDLNLCEAPLNAKCLYCLASGLNPRTIVSKLFKFLTGRRSGGKFRIDIKDISDKVDLFISPSNFLKNRFIELGIPPEKIIYSDNGMNTELFKAAAKTKSDKIRFGFIGTLILSKGVHVLIKAFNSIKDENATLKIYGKSPVNNGILDYYHRMRRMAGRNKRIEFRGAFDNKDAAGIFSEIDALVFPSIWPENSPLVIKEAFLTNTPVIASRIGGVPEFVKEGLNGILFKAGDDKDLRDKMKLFLDRKSLVYKMKPGNIVKTIEDNTAELEKIYSFIMGSR